MGLLRRRGNASQPKEPIPSGWVDIVNGLLRVRDWLDPDVIRQSDGSLWLWVNASPITGLLVGRSDEKWWITPMGYGSSGEPGSIGSEPSPVCHGDSSPEQVVQAILRDVAKSLYACILAFQAGKDIPEDDALWAARELRALEEAELVPRFRIDPDDE